MQIAWLIELVCFVTRSGDLDSSAASDGKPMQIDGVLLMCGYIADDSSMLVLDYATC